MHRKTTPPLSQTELNSIKSFNDRINLQDVRDVYLPLTNLIGIYKRSKEDLAFSKGIFLQKTVNANPLSLGFQEVLRLENPPLAVYFKSCCHEPSKARRGVGNNGWLSLSKCYLKEQEILNRKGFPESYDMELLLDFLNQIKNNKSVEIPVYSHEIYDIVPDEKQTILPADFVIVEGINVFQNPQNDSLYMTDFFDFSIYVDAAVDDIESWYIDRFQNSLH